MKWISVNKRIPNNPGEVLVFAPSCNIIGSILIGKCYAPEKNNKSKKKPAWVVYDFHESDMDAVVTHSMELPKAP